MAVYFIESGPGGCIKIGWSNDPVRRLIGMRTGNPEALSLLAVMPGDSKTESELHRRFDKHRVTREWFAPHVDIWKLIEKHWCYDGDNGDRKHTVVGEHVRTTVE